VTVQRNSNGTFGPASWVNLNYPGSTGITSSNSVFGNSVVGVIVGTDVFAYQATVDGKNN
jgi:trimeric autotransporter adhesin